MTVVKPTPEQEAFFRDVFDAVKRLAAQHKTITNKECIAILSRCAGICVNACAPEEQARMRQMAIQNIDAKEPEDVGTRLQRH